MHDRILDHGIAALANAKRTFGYPWFFGHSGAALLAGYFMLQENQFAEQATEEIERCLNEIVENQQALCEPTQAADDPVEIGNYLNVLRNCVVSHSATGHGVIFGVLALRAFLIKPSLLTKSNVDGIIDLLNDTLEDTPKRHYGIADYQAVDVSYAGMAEFESVSEAAAYSLQVHELIYKDQVIDDTFYFLAGDLLHCVTYAHALLDLEQLGYEDLAGLGLASLQQHMYLSSRSHEDLTAFTAPVLHDPRELKFWQRSLDEPHHIKLAYSSLALTRKYTEQQKKAVFSKLSVYWSFYT